MLSKYKAILLDMNNTFMFGEDRFDEDQNFFDYYQTTDGRLPPVSVNRFIRSAYEFLEERYPDPVYRDSFPRLEDAIRATATEPLSNAEVDNLIATFAAYERGSIPNDYAAAIRTLSSSYSLCAVIDIWAPKAYWIEEFQKVEILDCFSTLSFSSENGAVKPSPIGFLQALSKLGVAATETVFIGDSVRRDLGGALNAGLDCILVGGADDARATGSAANLLAVVDAL